MTLRSTVIALIAAAAGCGSSSSGNGSGSGGSSSFACDQPFGPGDGGNAELCLDYSS